MILKGLTDVLVADSVLAAGLASYDFGVEKPAVFTSDPPEDSARPCIVLSLAGGSNWDTRAKMGYETDVYAVLIGDKGSSTAALRALAWRMVRCLHRCEASFSGYGNIGVYATPPVAAYDPDGFPLWRTVVTCRVLEN